MAMTKCPDCGQECSDQARACPKCGRPIAEPPAIGAMIWGILIMGFGVIKYGFIDDNWFGAILVLIGGYLITLLAVKRDEMRKFWERKLGAGEDDSSEGDRK